MKNKIIGHCDADTSAGLLRNSAAQKTHLVGEPQFLMTLLGQTNSFRSLEMCYWFIIINAIYLLPLPPIFKVYKIVLCKTLFSFSQW